MDTENPSAATPAQSRIRGKTTPTRTGPPASPTTTSATPRTSR